MIKSSLQQQGENGAWTTYIGQPRDTIGKATNLLASKSKEVLLTGF
jgi:hypothetical protein